MPRVTLVSQKHHLTGTVQMTSHHAASNGVNYLKKLNSSRQTGIFV